MVSLSVRRKRRTWLETRLLPRLLIDRQSGTLRPVASRDRPGQRLGGKYELIEQTGEGGMAVVWRGIVRGEAGFEKTVAIKRLRPGCRHPSFVEMFVEEARVGAKLRHPNMVQVHDFGIDEQGQHYLVTDWVDGIDLATLLRKLDSPDDRLAWPLICWVAIEALKALHAAHINVDENGRMSPILHRDITPENILLDAAGVVRLADFGLARASDRDSMTSPDIVKGKLSYLAPELLDGSPAGVWSDIFSMGVVLWETLTRERLFDAPSDIEVLERIRAMDVPLLNMKRPDLPIHVTSCVHRALDRDPSRRYSTAKDMLLAIEEGLSVLPDRVDGFDLARAVAEARSR